MKEKLFLAILIIMLLPSVAALGQTCLPGQEQQCFCPDSSTSTQSCRLDGLGWNRCQCTYYSYWCDPDTDFCWQDPQKDAYNIADTGVTQPDAVRYCEELVMGGYDDWRLPNIDELRTIVRGDPGTVTGGDCPMTEGSPRADMNDPACGTITEFDGPGEGGCYWTPDLTGTCNKPDPAAIGHPLETCSSTVSSDDPVWIADVMFDNGAVPFNHILSLADVRCVRTGPSPQVTCAEAEACTPGSTRQCFVMSAPDELTPTTLGAQSCADDGSCFGPCESTGFTPSPPVVDVCPQCDQVRVTIKVPEKLTVTPKQIMAFLYAPDETGWSFPPLRPPDGGTSDDQIIDPVIDVDKPLIVTVPGCTYYRDKCLSGDYYLLIFLLNSEKMPPFPTDGEYAWGMIQEPITLGNGQQKVIDMEVTLVPCGEDTNGNGIGDACEEPKPTLIKLASFTATAKAWSVVLSWATESEIDNAGFNIYRAESENGAYAKINSAIVSAKGSSTQGTSYEFVDKEVKNRKTYYYKLEDIDLNGNSTMHGPVSAMPKWILRILGKY